MDGPAVQEAARPVRVLNAEALAEDHARRLLPAGRGRSGSAGPSGGPVSARTRGPAPSRSRGLGPSLDALGRLLAGVRQRWTGTGDVAELGSEESSALEWFLDNYFVIEEAVEQVGEALPPSFYRELPQLAGDAERRVSAAPENRERPHPAEQDQPRVQALAANLLLTGELHVALDAVVDFLDRYQTRSPLSLGEVWALPAMLRLLLLRELAWCAGRLAGVVPGTPGWEQAFGGVPGSDVRGSLAPDLKAGDAVARAVASLRVLDALDWEPVAERIGVVHRVLCGDPAGAYARMEYVSRDAYRRTVEAIARTSLASEPDVARAAVDLARATHPDQGRRTHVGYFLIDEGRPILEARVGARPLLAERLRRAAIAHATAVYVTVATLVGLAIVAASAWLARGGGPWIAALAALLALIPALTAAVAFVNWAVSRLLPPRVLPKLDFADGLPADHRTIVVVPGLVASTGDVDSLLRQLQEHHARNPDPALAFAVLGDFADAPAASMPEDDDLLTHAERALDVLNRDTPGSPFLFLHRRRLWNESEGVWMGWERKRGKLHEFNRLLLGEPETSYVLIAGDRTRLSGIGYVITLDADTVLPPDGARRLIGTLAHPLNRPVFDAQGRVAAGYTVLQPRVQIDPESAGRSRYTRVFAGDTTVDLYSLAVSDAYQDLFGAGMYVGKGIYDVAAFERGLAGRVPENTLLSHDLFEGMHGRAGLVTDVTVYEDYPPNYLVGLLRTHRWVRGDWQLLPWLAFRTPRVDASGPNDLPLIDRWKIADNLRRSLLAPATITLLLASWLGLPGPPLAWTLLALLTPLVQVVVAVLTLGGAAVASLVDRRRTDAWRYRAYGLRATVARLLMFAAGLAIEGALAVDAVARTLWRLVVSRRRLLEWTTAAGATRLVGTDVTIRAAVRSAAPSVIATAAVGILVSAGNPQGVPWALPFLLLWLAGPWFVVWVSRPLAPRGPAPLTEEQRRTFGALARRTWLFFETHVGPEDHWLPPDNVQEQPVAAVAHRTSPTNIGLYLLSCLAAHDRGYLSTAALVSRLGLAFDALDRVERHRGHIPNWLDTTTLQPLHPAYVSTVDSGNLAACLIILAQGCEEASSRDPRRPLARQGLADAVALLAEGVPRTGRPESQALLAYLEQLEAGFEASVSSDAHGAAGVGHRLSTLLADLAESHALDLDALTTLRLHAGVIERQLQAAERDASGTPASPLDLDAELKRLASRARAMVDGLDLAFLYNRDRNLFHIGFNLETGTLDGSYYDLLASEARLTSLVAIALDQVPQKHWLHLGRPMTRTPEGDWALLSWSGTMFEYLLPALLAECPPASLLGRTNAAAIRRQIGYARDRGVPWGISESGFYAFDPHRNYQYRAFGVPGLALQRQPGDDLVITPYASLMATPFAPGAVAENLARLAELGAIGRLGAYEAVDYTRSRVPFGREFALVQSHMAHHQGMILLALAQALDGPRMIERFHAEPAAARVSVLVREELPQVPQATLTVVGEADATGPAPAVRHAAPWVASEGGRPGVHWLSNGTYGVLVTGSGGGYSTRGPTSLTRWRADASVQHWGTWCYLTDLDSGERWTATAAPLGEGAAEPAVFHPARAEYRAVRDGVRTLLEVTVAPEDAVELRRLEVVNDSDRPRRLAVTCFTEVVLTDQQTDLRHPAFGKLFIEADAVPGEPDALLFRRRPRSADETPVSLALALVTSPDADGRVSWGEVRRTADRAEFLGRLRTPANPLALDADGWWGPVERDAGRSSSVDPAARTGAQRDGDPVEHAPLDPAAAIGRTLVVPPGGRARLAWVAAAADTDEVALELLQRHRSWAHVDHVFTLAGSRADHELRDLGFAGDDLAHAQRLLSLLVFGDPALAAPAASTPAPALPHLWGLGISGDLPLIVAHLAGEADLPLVEDLLRAHRYWRRRRGVQVDLALVDEQASSYAEGLRGPVQRLIRRWGAELALNVRGGVFLVSADQLDGPALATLHRAAQVVFPGGSGGLADRLARLPEPPAPLPAFDPEGPPAATQPDAPAPSASGMSVGELAFDNGLGGFGEDGTYVIRAMPGQPAPAPWSNVIATESAGFLCTETGLGATWAGNSGENRLTPWRNDPLTDLPSEAVYLRDEETGAVWTPTPRPAGAPVAYVVRHGAGDTTYEHASHGLEQRVRAFAWPDAPAKAVTLRVADLTGRPRRLTVTYYAEWVLGVYRDGTAHRLATSYDPGAQALLAENPFHPDRPAAVAFLTSDRPVHGWTSDRAEFLGRPGSTASPPGLARIGLARTAGVGHDPCAALQIHLDLAAGGVEEVTFLLGQGASREEALRLAAGLRGSDAETSWALGRERWTDLLGTVRVETPDPALNLLVNHWLPYQNLSARMWGRTGYYQSSGAYGFRDQLQDSLALLWSRPRLVREHLLRAAAHQFGEGDVLHWWHEPTRGVRTRISDDLLWLPYVVARYVGATGDVGVLDEQVPFLRGDPLAPGEHERYDTWAVSGASADLFEHCRRAVQRGVTAGAHGLPLMGTGDWNDGMNRIGDAGRGESVWLGWFAYAVLGDMASLCERRGSDADAARYGERAERLRSAVEEHGWDGDWYLRAFDDEGRPVGSAGNAECRIDSIAQSWAVLSGARPERASRAVKAAIEQLVLDDPGLVLLFTPPFDRGGTDPGYIKGYLPGLRENGGQYTHGATWLAWAAAGLGDGTTAVRLLDLMNPIGHGDSAGGVGVYRGEPYVLAGDVYSGAHAGRAGWTWYTGSSGWYYRAAVEAVLGLRLRDGELVVDPVLPDAWPGFRATVRREGRTWQVVVGRRPDGSLDVRVDEDAGRGAEEPG